jgi:hypothetical protein
VNRTIKNSSKTPVNSYLGLFAKEMPRLIDQWRAEISERKHYRAYIKSARLEKFLSRAEDNGLPAALVAVTVLCCEWAFRIRLATEEDIERELTAIQEGFCKPLNPVLTRFQAELLVKILEPGLRKEMKEVRIPVTSGFGAGGSHLGLALFMRGESLSKRVPYKHVVPTRRGRIPILGPIIASVIVGELFEERLGEDGWKMGRELSEILLNTKVLAPRFRAWQTIVGKVLARFPASRPPFTERARRAHHQLFEMPGEAISPESFLERCKTNPSSVIGWFAQEEVLEAVYAEKWGESKTSRKLGPNMPASRRSLYGKRRGS